MYRCWCGYEGNDPVKRTHDNHLGWRDEMTDLKEMDKLEKPQIKHNWLYSVNPGPAESIYLVGYDKQCRKYFTAKLHTDNMTGIVAIRELDIPVWGCEPVD